MTHKRSILRLLLILFILVSNTPLSQGMEPGVKPPGIRIKTGIEVLKEHQPDRCRQSVAVHYRHSS